MSEPHLCEADISSDGEYFGWQRPELLELVPDSAVNIVDIGCGVGGLGRALKEKFPGSSVYGVELCSKPAEEAGKYLDDVYNGSADDGPFESWGEHDCLIFGDLLEHLPDPWGCLERWLAQLKTGGTVIVSLPNISHVSIVEGLLCGEFRYADAGILDRTHLRFFTHKSMVELLEGAGLSVESMSRKLSFRTDRRNYKIFRRFARRLNFKGRGEKSRIGRFVLSFFTYQYVFRCIK